MYRFGGVPYSLDRLATAPCVQDAHLRVFTSAIATPRLAIPAELTLVDENWSLWQGPPMRLPRCVEAIQANLRDTSKDEGQDVEQTYSFEARVVSACFWAPLPRASRWLNAEGSTVCRVAQVLQTLATLHHLDRR